MVFSLLLLYVVSVGLLGAKSENVNTLQNPCTTESYFSYLSPDILHHVSVLQPTFDFQESISEDDFEDLFSFAALELKFTSVLRVKFKQCLAYSFTQLRRQRKADMLFPFHYHW